MAFWYNMSWPFSLNLHFFIWIWALDFLNCNAKFYILPQTFHFVDSIPVFLLFFENFNVYPIIKNISFPTTLEGFFLPFFFEDLILSMEVHCSDGPVTGISLFLSLTGIVGPHVFWGDHRTVSHLVMRRRVSDSVDLWSRPSLSPLLCAYQASPLPSPHHCCQDPQQHSHCHLFPGNRHCCLSQFLLSLLLPCIIQGATTLSVQSK